MTRIEKLRNIVKKKQCGKIDGMLVDTFTASAIIACYDRGNDHTKRVIETLPLTKIASIALGMVNK